MNSRRLLRIREWSANASTPFDYLAVCSDESVAGEDDFVQRTSELGLPVTTYPDVISAFLRGASILGMWWLGLSGLACRDLLRSGAGFGPRRLWNRGATQRIRRPGRAGCGGRPAQIRSVAPPRLRCVRRRSTPSAMPGRFRRRGSGCTRTAKRVHSELTSGHGRSRTAGASHNLGVTIT
jgi:hypothetical protein